MILPSQQVTVREVASRLRNDPNPPLLLDVREEVEWNESHIEGASLIPLGQLPQRVHELPEDREIVCVCRSGQRSAIATEFLTRTGRAATNMTGGMLAWLREDLPAE